jgi:hypothetical protein
MLELGAASMGFSKALHTKISREDTTTNGNLSRAQLIIINALLAVALWNAIEMVPLVFFTFKRFRSLYFWSICVATLGVMLCILSQILSTWGPELFNRILTISPAISCLGWAFMVTGQSFVLYSRLHLLNVQRRTLQLVCTMIIFDGVTLHIVGTAFTLEPLITHSKRLESAYDIFEKVQIVVFMVQEFVLSGIYLWKAYAFLGHCAFSFQISPTCSSSAHRPRDRDRRLLLCLVAANIVVMMLDVTIIALEYAGFHQLQLSYKIFA